MDYEFGYHPRAAKQADKQEPDTRERIQKKLREMVTDEWRELFDYDVASIEGVGFDIYRARIGDWRVFFVIDDSRCAILHMDQREGAYGNTDRLESRADDYLES